MALIEVRLRPTGPWRVGHRGGDRERVDVVYHSDALYSALTHAMRALGWMEEWLDATARAETPAVRLSSLFPFAGKTRLIAPPRTVWPPSGRGQLFYEGAKLVPLEVLRHGVQDESRWEVDGECQCLLPMNAQPPFRVAVRESAAVDRLTGVAEPHRTACLEFAANAGWWGLVQVSDKTWETRIKAAFKLAADSGFGGERSRGWGRAQEPQFHDAGHLIPAGNASDDQWWLLSLCSPAADDKIDWSRSEHTLTARGGWTDSPSGAALKREVRMIEEGSVIAAPELKGRAVDVAPEGFAHPVYRNGIALALPVPVVVASKQAAPVEAEPVVVEPANTSETPADTELTATYSGPLPTESGGEQPDVSVPLLDSRGSEAVADVPEPATPTEAEPHETTEEVPE